RADGKEVKTDFDCTTDGKECEFKLDGQAAKISFWFNGTVLVEMESRGSNRETIVEKKMRLSGDGKSMSVEYVPVAGGGQAGEMLRPGSAVGPVGSGSRRVLRFGYAGVIALLVFSTAQAYRIQGIVSERRVDVYRQYVKQDEAISQLRRNSWLAGNYVRDFFL